MILFYFYKNELYRYSYLVQDSASLFTQLVLGNCWISLKDRMHAAPSPD